MSDRGFIIASGLRLRPQSDDPDRRVIRLWAGPDVGAQKLTLASSGLFGSLDAPPTVKARE